VCGGGGGVWISFWSSRNCKIIIGNEPLAMRLFRWKELWSMILSSPALFQSCLSHHNLSQTPELSMMTTMSSRSSVFVDHDAEQRASILQKVNQLRATLDSIQTLFKAGSSSADAAVKMVFYRDPCMQCSNKGHKITLCNQHPNTLWFRYLNGQL
jgi:hypothetical protein